MSNTITAYFKGRTGVAESVYQNDYGIVMVFDSIDLPAHFDCYFSVSGSNTAISGIGADNRVAIPNSVLAKSGKVEIHIPLHTGDSDSEVEYVVYFKVIGRARPEDDGTPEQMTAIEQAIALLQTPIGNIESIVNEALSFTGDTFEEMKEDLQADYDAFTETVNDNIADVEADFASLNSQYQTAVSALTVDSEVQNIRVANGGVTYASAGDAVRVQVSDVKKSLEDLNNGLQTFGFDYQFVYGYIYQGNVTTGITYRFVPQNIMVYDRPIVVSIANGFRAGYHMYNNDDSYKMNVGWQTGTLTIPANQKFRLEIARVTENTSEKASYAEFVGAVTFKSNIEIEFDNVNSDISDLQSRATAIETDIDSKFETQLVSEAQVSMTGSSQFVTRALSIPCSEIGEYCSVYVESTTNVTAAKPIRYRFVNDSNTVIGSDKYIATGKTGVLPCPSGATKFLVSLYGTTSGELSDKTAYFNNVKIWKGDPANDSIADVAAESLYAQNITLKGFSACPDNPLIPSYAHKGYAFTAPECTGAAVIEAKRRGYTGVENDTQVTSDGHIVMWHDDTLSKIGDSAHGISDYTLAELKAKDFGTWKNPKYAGEKILTFEEWAKLCKDLGLKIIVDTKFEWSEEQVTALANTIIALGMADDTKWFVNFNGGYTLKLIELIPNVMLNYIGTATAERCELLADLMSTYSGISVALSPEVSLVTAEDVARAHSYGIKHYCYTAVDFTDIDIEAYKSYMENVMSIGIDAMTSDIYRYVDIANAMHSL